MRAVVIATVRKLVAERVARPAQASPPFEELRIALADRTAGPRVGARSLQLTRFRQATRGCGPRSRQHDQSGCGQYQSMHASTSGSSVVRTLRWALTAQSERATLARTALASCRSRCRLSGPFGSTGLRRHQPAIPVLAGPGRDAAPVERIAEPLPRDRSSHVVEGRILARHG